MKQKSTEMCANVKRRGHQGHSSTLCPQFILLQKGLKTADMLRMLGLQWPHFRDMTEYPVHGTLNLPKKEPYYKRGFINSNHSKVYFLHKAFFLPIIT